MHIGTTPEEEKSLGKALPGSGSLLIPSLIFYRCILLPMPTLETVPGTKIWENRYLQLLLFLTDQSTSTLASEVLLRWQNTVWLRTQEDQLWDQGWTVSASIIRFLSVFINVGKSTQILLQILFRSDGSVQTAHHCCLGFIWDLK